MKNILIPTDFSENAGDALAYVLDLIDNQKAHIHIINIINPNFLPVEAPELNVSLLGTLINDVKSRLDVLEAFSIKRFGEGDSAQITISTDVITGTVSQSIKNEAIAKNIDLIIMGTKGKNHDAKSKLFGTISSSTLVDAPCPVILVPQGFKFKPIDTLVYASNLDPGDPYELWRAVELLKPHIGIVRFLYIKNVEINDKIIKQYSKYIESHSPSVQTIFDVVKSDNIEESIISYANNYDAEMIIMHRLHNSLWSRIFNKSHTKQIMFKINSPLMVVNHNEK